MYNYPIETHKGIQMTQTQYKLEDFKVGQKVKVLVDLGTYVFDMKFSRLGQIGEIMHVGYRSVRVLFTTAIGEYRHSDQWYRPEEIQPLITTNAERQEEITRLKLELLELQANIMQLEQEIKANPEKIKAEVGDTVRFVYDTSSEYLMFIVDKQQAKTLGEDFLVTEYNFAFVGFGCRNRVDTVVNGCHKKLELKKKNTSVWIDNKEVDWSGILN
jgi:ribosomal protein L21E